ncbi:FRG domain-containing protein [Acidocella sp. KAb 2-4]|uniref:FRG domain-containing protein n=1 Tax=Acidocella sp. KAb 2-4 TaxID=2885158 RepID=UPI001D05D9CF|nr:FRG domain-containing protein [Acidocella sp. KAb 2-4]MCB5944575.1 FRG domain-containing protein [Acidocella sp. KAb 2-4]
MKEERVSNWQELLRKLRLYRDEVQANVLFRGQADASWSLSTTLERYDEKRAWFLDHYFMQAEAVRVEIETLTEKKFEIHPDKIAEKFFNFNLMLTFSEAGVPGLPYFSYLRQHGFPSPFLDWSRSMYVAAFFAFHGASQGAKEVSIFALNAKLSATRSKAWPNIVRFGDRNGGHRRHFMQQGEYTLCLQWERAEAMWKIVPHEAALKSGIPDSESFYEIVKFIIPISEKGAALRELDEQNINAYTLFGSEEGLINTMAFRKLGRNGA